MNDGYRTCENAAGIRILRIDSIRNNISFINENEKAKRYYRHPKKNGPRLLPDPEPPPQRPTSPRDSTVTLFLSLDLCCARASEETIILWGYHPQELAHKSIYAIVASMDKPMIQRMHERLLEDIWHKSSTSKYEDIRHLFPSERVISSLVSQADPSALTGLAEEGHVFTETISIIKRLGDRERFQVSLYLGGGLGGNLRFKATFSKLYIVAKFTRMGISVSDSRRVRSDPNRSRGLNGDASPKQQQQQQQDGEEIAIFSNVEELPVRPGLLPGHFSRNCRLNTISFSDPKSVLSPRVHVALKHDVSQQKHFRLSAPNQSTPLHAIPGNPSSTQAYRHAPTFARNTAVHSFFNRATTSASPTMQYFLQTSSSSLNAAASAIQGRQPSETETETEAISGGAGPNSRGNKALGKTDGTQQQAPRMSIRSLLS